MDQKALRKYILDQSSNLYYDKVVEVDPEIFETVKSLSKSLWISIDEDTWEDYIKEESEFKKCSEEHLIVFFLISRLSYEFTEMSFSEQRTDKAQDFILDALTALIMAEQENKNWYSSKEYLGE